MGEFYLEESAIVLKRCPDLCPHVFLPIRNQEFYGLPNFVALKKQFNAKFAFMDQLSTFLSKSLVHVGSPEDVFESVIKEYRPVLAQESVKCVLDPLIIELFNQARFIKTPSEIAAMRYAAQVGARAHQLISRDLEQLKSESMIELSLYMYSLQCGARLQAYNPVVAAGPHTTVLHFLTGETADRGLKPVLPGEFVLVDASASWQGYASDMTRTYAKDMTQEMRKMHNLVALALEKAKAKYVIGAAWNSVGEEAQRVLLKGLVECGILAGTFEQLTESGALQAFLPHAIGHPIGLEVHDTAPYSSYTDGQMNYNLTIGMVHAIEPGIYFIPHVIDGIRNDSSHHLHELIDWVVIEKFLHVGGIRLEDMVAIDYSGKAQVLNTIDW